MAEGADDLLVQEARTITNEARDAGVHLRLLGALAIHLHSERWEDFGRRLARLGDASTRFTDLDFAAYGKERSAVRTLLEDRFGLTMNAQAMLFHGKERLLYVHPSKGYHVDVFFDRLSFSHTVEFGAPGTGRLDADFPTLAPADLLLSKLQIHRFTEKDTKDVVLLLRAHAVAAGEQKDAVSAARVCEPLAEDWGFWKDATTNLAAVRDAARRLQGQGILDSAEAGDVAAKVGQLLAAIEAAPKGRAWQKGERKLAGRQWWDDVEEVVR